MTINQRQLVQMEAAGKFDLRSQIEKLIKEFFLNYLTKMQPDELNNVITYQVESAKNYDIISVDNLIPYVIVSFLFGKKFDKEIKLFSDILNDARLINEQKIDLLTTSTKILFNYQDETTMNNKFEGEFPFGEIWASASVKKKIEIAELLRMRIDELNKQYIKH